LPAKPTAKTRTGFNYDSPSQRINGSGQRQIAEVTYGENTLFFFQAAIGFSVNPILSNGLLVI
jgi:hypothetical protein